MAQPTYQVAFDRDADVTLRAMDDRERLDVLHVIERSAERGLVASDRSVEVVDRSANLYVCRLGRLRIAFTLAPDESRLTVRGVFDADFLDRIANDRAYARAE